MRRLDPRVEHLEWKAGSVDYRLELPGLIEVPMPARANGVYWLRFYRSMPRSVAVLTEVPGNPGLSITNGIKFVCEVVAQRCRVDLASLDVFEVWPKGSCSRPGIRRVTFTGDGKEKPPGSRAKRVREHAPFTGRPEWWDSSWSELERLVGSVEALPAHDELYGAVLALGGGTEQELWRDVFEAVPVADLPPPHNPSSCRYASRFRRIERGLRASGVRDPLVAGQQFLDSLTPEERSACEHHQANWRAIADESVRILETLGPQEPGSYIAAARASTLCEPEDGFLMSLFYDPVFIGGGSYTNGQHRGCALRFSGAERATVVTGTESLGTVCDDWTYEGDG